MNSWQYYLKWLFLLPINLIKVNICNKINPTSKIRGKGIIAEIPPEYAKIATSITNKMAEKKDMKVYAFDPMTILIIIRIIWEIFKCYMNYKFSDKQALNKVKNPSLLDRIFLRGLVKRVVQSEKYHDAVIGELYTQLIEHGKTMGPEDVQKLKLDEVHMRHFMGESNE